jgi:hypothetical protein
LLTASRNCISTGPSSNRIASPHPAVSAVNPQRTAEGRVGEPHPLLGHLLASPLGFRATAAPTAPRQSGCCGRPTDPSEMPRCSCTEAPILSEHNSTHSKDYVQNGRLPPHRIGWSSRGRPVIPPAGRRAIEGHLWNSTPDLSSGDGIRQNTAGTAVDRHRKVAGNGRAFVHTREMDVRLCPPIHINREVDSQRRFIGPPSEGDPSYQIRHTVAQ